VQTVRAAAHGDDDFGGPAVFGGNGVGDDGELLHRVQSRIVSASPAARRQAGAVEDEFSGVVEDAVGPRALHASQLVEEVAEASAVDGQLVDAFVLQRGANGRLIG